MRRLVPAVIIVLLLINTWFGIVKIATFHHAHLTDTALLDADVETALPAARASIWWSPRNAQGYLLVAQVVRLAQANGLPLRTLEGRSTMGVFGFGMSGVTAAIALNPADELGWFNIAMLHRSFKSANERLERLRRAGEAPAVTQEEKPAGLDPLDRVVAAAALKALEMAPGYYYYHEFLAELYWKCGMKQDAAREIRASFGLLPALYGHPQVESKEFIEEMAEPILEGIDDSSRSPHVEPAQSLRARAEILTRLSRYEEAIRAYQDLRAQDGRELEQECDVALGEILQRQGLWRESLEPLKKAADAGHDTAWGALSLSYSGEALSRLGEHEAARASFQKHLTLQPDSAGVYESLGRELVILGRPEEAEKVLIAAVRRFPSEPRMYENVVKHLRSQGRPREAMAYAQALRKVDGISSRLEKLMRELEEEARQQAP
ncbi:MAG: tetratricopeptide repeat protein [Candidatus Polarisedimenticolia bacterium]